MRPWSLAAVIVITLSLVNGVAYLARRRALARAAALPASAPSPGLPPRVDPHEAAPGLLLVTTTPRGLLGEVDGEARDLTPARVLLSPGHHQVVLKEGARVLTDETVEVHGGAAAVIAYTLEAPRTAEPEQVPVAAVQEDP